MNSLISRDRLVALVGSIRPGIEALLAQYDRNQLHVVVLADKHAGGGYDVVYNNSLAGAVADYPSGKPFHENAMAKANLSLRTKMDTVDVLTHAPQLLQKGDFLYPGGVYFPGGSVGVSGTHAPMDHAIAAFVAAIIVAECRIAVEEVQKAVGAGKASPRLGAAMVPTAA